MFETLRTDRLIVRAPVAADVDALHARRNDPGVAELQAWTLPYPHERCVELVEGAARMGGPTADAWWMATVCLADTGDIVGDLAVRLEWEGRSAEIGFTLARHRWGSGFAYEATEAMVAWLFGEVGVQRIHALTHPDNVASAILLERLGMLYEGRTRGSFWVGDECTDDVLYGMTAADHTAWLERPVTPPTEVRFVEITPDNVRAVVALSSNRSQRRFVAPVRHSLVDALVPEVVDGAPVTPWFRAVEADGEPVAFVMLAEKTAHHPTPYLWRLLVDRRHQRRGIGRTVVDLLVERCRRQGASQLDVSWRDGRGSPRAFYESYGFVPTGNLIDGEVEARLDL